MDGSESKKIMFKGKQAQDAFTPKGRRIRAKAVDTEPTHLEQIALVEANSSSIHSAIDAKVKGYKQQDVRRSLLNIETLVTREQVTSKLRESGLQCQYCLGL